MTAPTRAGHYNPDDPYLADQVPLRHVALMNAAAGVRVRRRDIPVDKVLLVLASVLVPVGIVLILVGWWGAAHTGKLFEQIDYLISGGLLGVALAVIGGFLYFGYWLSRQLDESRRYNELQLRALQRINGQLALLGVPDGQLTPAGGNEPVAHRNGDVTSARLRAAAPPASSSEADRPTAEVPVMLVATPRGSLLHRPDCPVVRDREGLRPVAAGTPGFRYCAVCDAATALDER